MGSSTYGLWTLRDSSGDNRSRRRAIPGAGSVPRRGRPSTAITAVGSSRSAAQAALKVDLAARLRAGGAGDSLNAGSPFPLVAEAWMEDVMLDVDRAQGTQDVYQGELRGLVLPYFEHFTVHEVTVGRIELFLRMQRAKSYARAKHSRTILGVVLAFAVRREIIPRNPMQETSRMRKPPHAPKALTTEQIAAIRLAAREWRTGEGRMGPRSDGQVRDIIEVMLRAGLAARRDLASQRRLGAGFFHGAAVRMTAWLFAGQVTEPSFLITSMIPGSPTADSVSTPRPPFA